MHASSEESPFTPGKQQIALAGLCDWYPSTFALEKFKPHLPAEFVVEVLGLEPAELV